MGDVLVKDQVYAVADQLLQAGRQPEVQQIADELGLEQGEVTTWLEQWWQQLPDRVSFSGANMMIPDLPETISAAFSRIWQQAVQEAEGRYSFERQRESAGADVIRRESEDALKQSKDRYQELESRYRESQVKTEGIASQLKAAEAEISVLKNSVASETSLRKKEEQLRSNAEQELVHLRKTFEDSKRTFDQRIKDEQRHNVEALSKADADTRYYRNALEKLRDEAGKQESLLTRDIHDLQAQLAKRNVKLETQQTQIRSLEEELKDIKNSSNSQSRNISKVNADLLAEANKNKRLSDRVAELENEIKRLNQKGLMQTTEASRRENALRNEIKARDEEAMRATAKVTSLEKRLIGQDEEIRRLNARI